LPKEQNQVGLSGVFTNYKAEIEANENAAPGKIETSGDNIKTNGKCYLPPFLGHVKNASDMS
jgi:hypothetical protein